MAGEALLAWIRVADLDIKAIRNNLFGPDPTADIAAYHCQQAAEKLVKALLLAADIHPPKTHDIEALVDRLPNGHPLLPLIAPLGRFTEFVTSARYPGPDPFADVSSGLSIADVASWLAEIQGVRAEIVRFLEVSP
ncbi:HEPN domain-containing protein [Azospirillum thermophilum]|nr:HEPN domain-containing protein [Azospirillum thermophilum]